MTLLQRTLPGRVWFRSRPTDLRLGFHGLLGLVEREFHRTLSNGDLFVFVNWRRTSARNAPAETAVQRIMDEDGRVVITLPIHADDDVVASALGEAGF